jgi:Flp pilus assembly pilin Flp
MLDMLVMLTVMVKAKTLSFLRDERGEVNIVAIVVLIGIAVLLAIVFRRQIESLLNTLFTAIRNSATNAITE